MGVPKIIEVQSGVDGHVTVVAHSLNHSVTALGTSEGLVKVIRNKLSSTEIATTFKVPAPVTALTWAHPEQGRVLAVATASGHLQIWTQQPDAPEAGAQISGSVRSQFHHNNKPLRSVAFAPKQLGLVVACTGDDGMVRVYEADQPLDPQSWLLQSSFQAAPEGCTCLCWQPYARGVPPLLAVGSGSGAHLWMWNTPEMRWQRLAALTSGPVAALHWAASMGRDRERVAVASGGAVRVHTLRMEEGELRTEAEGEALEAGSRVWRVEWNMLGTVLGCSTAAGEVQLWQQALDGVWRRVSTIKGLPSAADEHVA